MLTELVSKQTQTHFGLRKVIMLTTVNLDARPYYRSSYELHFNQETRMFKVWARLRNTPCLECSKFKCNGQITKIQLCFIRFGVGQGYLNYLNRISGLSELSEFHLKRLSESKIQNSDNRKVCFPPACPAIIEIVFILPLTWRVIKNI